MRLSHHEIRVKAFLARAGTSTHHTVKSDHQLTRIRRIELSFDPTLMEKAAWAGRLGVGGLPIE